MESEKIQRKQKKDQIGENLEAELIPMEHSEKRGNKVVTVMKATPYAYVDNLVEQITTFVDENAKLVNCIPKCLTTENSSLNI